MPSSDNNVALYRVPLTAIVIPNNATYKTVLWNVRSGGTVPTTYNSYNNTLVAEGAGMIILDATVVRGLTLTNNYVKSHTIEALPFVTPT